MLSDPNSLGWVLHGVLWSFVLIAFMVGYTEPSYVARRRGALTTPLSTPTTQPTFVPFDRDYAAIGAIEPVFEEKVTYATERIEIEPETVEVTTGSGELCYSMKIDHKIVLCDPPIPIVRKELRWRKV